MPLPPPSTERNRIHRRNVKLDGFKRTDGLWDIEAHLVDTKDHDFPLSTGLLKSGNAVHDMRVRVTIDSRMNVVDVVVCTESAPFMGYCDSITPDYSRIIGLNLFNGFLKAVKEMFGNSLGCAHLSELLMFLPTAALQTLTGEALDNDAPEHKPYQIDRCHALVSHSETVRRYFPRWYRDQNPG